MNLSQDSLISAKANNHFLRTAIFLYKTLFKHLRFWIENSNFVVEICYNDLID